MKPKHPICVKALANIAPRKIHERTHTMCLLIPVFVILGLGPAFAVNNPPTIGAISNQATYVDQPNLDGLLPIRLNVSDPETATNDLSLSLATSDPALVAAENVVIHYFSLDGHWYITLVPAFGRTGTATNTVTVSDGTNSVNTSFVLTVKPPPPGAARFASTNAIAIPDVGAATPYPSTINVSGMSGTITNLSLTLSKINHSWIRDVSMLLVSPTGQGMVVFTRISSGFVTNVTATLTDQTTFHLPDSFELWSERFWPTTNSVPNSLFPAPAPLGPYGPVTFSNSFNGLPANGTWSLYVYDNGATDHGSIAGGWSLMIATTGGNAAPTISDIPDQSTTVNTVVTNAFTINDADTPIGNLTLSSSSSNLELVPTNNIVFGGSGTNRTVTVTPAQNQTGSATITITVSDGTNTASDSFILTVNLVNTPPTITGIADQTIDEDTSTAALGFTVGDMETPAGSLTVSGVSSNHTLIPNSNLVFGGNGSNRTVNVTPAANQNGTSLITLTVSDGQFSTNTSFSVTVNPVNDPPTISDIANQSISTNGTTGPLSFTIGDVDTPVSSLVLSAASSNPALIPTNDIVFGGSGTTRTVTATPVTGQAGATLITLTVSDGSLSSNTSFWVTVFDGPCDLVAAYSFNAGTGTIVADSSGYNNNGTIVAATWTNSGRYGSALFFDGTSALITIHDAPSLQLTTGMTLEAWVRPTTVSSVWRDVIYKGDDNYFLEATSTSGGVPAMGGTFSTSSLYGPTALTVDTWAHLAATYDGATMRLYVNGTQVASQPQTGAMATSTNSLQIGGDDIYGQHFSGTIDEVRIYNRALTATEIQGDMNTPIVTAATNTAPTITSIGNQTIDEDTATAAIAFTVADAETAAGSLTVSGASSNQALVPDTNIVFGGGSSNRTVIVTPTANQNGTTLITVTVSDGSLSNSTSFLVTVNAVNDPPTISDLPDQLISVNTATPAIPFVVNDVDTDPSSLVLTGSSSNTNVVSNADIVFGGASSNRTVTVTPLANRVGTATITVTVSDGVTNVSDSFVLTVGPGQLTVEGITAADKVYDGTSAAALSVTGAALVGIVGAPDVALNTAGATGTFDNKNVGTGKTVQIAGLTLSGANAGNYVLTQPTANANITARPLTVTANSTNKIYGSIVIFAGTEFVTEGLTNGDTVTSVSLTSSGAVNTAAVGSYDITVSNPNGIGLGNYAISYVDGTLVVVAPQPEILSLAGDGTTSIVITWSAVSNVTYRVEYNTDLSDTNWVDLPPDITATSGTASAVDSPGEVAQRFYRVKIAP
jgi:subtilisin-like proprotein convertase family protein